MVLGVGSNGIGVVLNGGFKLLVGKGGVAESVDRYVCRLKCITKSGKYDKFIELMT